MCTLATVVYLELVLLFEKTDFLDFKIKEEIILGVDFFESEQLVHERLCLGLGLLEGKHLDDQELVRPTLSVLDFMTLTVPKERVFSSRRKKSCWLL